jgi:glutamate dehydrogenase/leucine dehydrogenase
VHVLLLQTVDAFVVFDLDDAQHAAGGTRLAPDVSEREGELLARAMTYKFAVLGRPMGGAKGLVRARANERTAAMARFCEEIRPLVASRRFLTGPDLGTYEADFAPLRTPDWEPHVLNSVVDGVAFEDVLTGFGVVAAADAAQGGLAGRAVAVEGFGKVGAGVAREFARRGGRVVAVSTLAGCVADPAGIDVDQLWEARTAHGDDFVAEVGRPVLPRDALFETETDVLVPGARVGVVDGVRAPRISASAVVPAANVPYTAAGLEILHARGIAAHADFVCNAAAVVGYTSAAHASQQQVLDVVERTIVDLVHSSSDHPGGPFAGACAIAETFLRTWRPAGDTAPGPPLA